MNLIEHIKSLNFELIGVLPIVEGLPLYYGGAKQNGFKLTKNVQPSIYLWVAEKQGSCFVFYVGKANKGFFPNRYSTHRSGLNGGSKSGEAKLKLINKLMDRGYTFFVYERLSNKVDESVLKKMRMPPSFKFEKFPESLTLVDSEEVLFIEYFKQRDLPGSLLGNGEVSRELQKRLRVIENI